MTNEDLYAFIHARRLCVVSTVSETGAPEAALVNIAVTPDLELIFYTLQTNRKCVNLRRNPRVAAVVGWEESQTLQYEGVAHEPVETELTDCERIYLERFPDRVGQSMWPGLTFFRVRPLWIRYSSYEHPWHVEEFSFSAREAEAPQQRAVTPVWKRQRATVDARVVVGSVAFKFAKMLRAAIDEHAGAPDMVDPFSAAPQRQHENLAVEIIVFVPREPSFE